MRAPTARQRLVLAAIESYRQQHGFAPSRADLANAFACRPNAIQGDLRRLRAKGLVTWEPGRARTVRVNRTKLTETQASVTGCVS